MIDPVVSTKIAQDLGLDSYRAPPAESDDAVLNLARQHNAPILTRDRDFERRHRNGEDHHGILFDPGMHHRAPTEVVAAVSAALDVMDKDDLAGTVVRINRFY